MSSNIMPSTSEVPPDDSGSTKSGSENRYNIGSGQLYDIVVNMLTCSPTFSLLRFDNDSRSVTFNAYDGGNDLTATVVTQGAGSVVQTNGEDSSDILDVKHVQQFRHDLQQQIADTTAYRAVHNNTVGVAQTTRLGSRVQQLRLVWYKKPPIIIGLSASFALVLIIVFFVVSCGGNSTDTKNDGLIAISDSSDSFKEQDYEDVVTQLETAGFTNVTAEAKEDLITGWVHKENSVIKVSVNGNTDYYSSDRFAPDAKIVVTYHAFPADDVDSESPSQSSSDSQTPEASASTSTSTSASATPKAPATITIENNPEFAAVLKGNGTGSAVIEFAKKYQGKTIEFDGNIANVQPYENYKTRFLYLITAGDYSPDNQHGPNFHLTNVGYADLKLTGDNIPDSIGEGLNIHILAKIKSYDDSNTLFELEPVAISMR